MLTFATEAPSVPQSTIDTSWILFAIGTTIIGAIALNMRFKVKAGLKTNNIYSWLIFFSHLVLIPLTYLILDKLMFM
jgi:hypothetical protein